MVYGPGGSVLVHTYVLTSAKGHFWGMGDSPPSGVQLGDATWISAKHIHSCFGF